MWHDTPACRDRFAPLWAAAAGRMAYRQGSTLGRAPRHHVENVPVLGAGVGHAVGVLLVPVHDLEPVEESARLVGGVEGHLGVAEAGVVRAEELTGQDGTGAQGRPDG